MLSILDLRYGFSVLVTAFLLASISAGASQSPPDSPKPWCMCGEAECGQIAASHNTDNCECYNTKAECYIWQDVNNRERSGGSRLAQEAEQLPSEQVFLTFEPHKKTLIVVEAAPQDIGFSARESTNFQPKILTKILGSDFKRKRYQYQLPVGTTVDVRGHTFESRTADIIVDGNALGEKYDGVLVTEDGKLKPHLYNSSLIDEIAYSTITFSFTGVTNRVKAIFVADLMPSEASYATSKGEKKLIQDNLNPVFVEDVTIEVRNHKIDFSQGEVYIDGRKLEFHSAVISRFGGIQHLPNDANK